MRTNKYVIPFEGTSQIVPNGHAVEGMIGMIRVEPYIRTR